MKTVGEWLDGLIKAAEGGGKAAAGGGSDKIGNVAAGGAGADKESVNRIAGAIKGIVEAAKKVEGVKFEPTKAADVDGGDGNKKAGKLFGNAGADAGDVNKAAAAVGAVSGEQILNAIVTAAGQAGKDGKKADDATNAIEAAIGGGGAAEFGDGNDKIGKKNDQIAAALVLRGVAKSGKFAGANNETEKVKAVVESAVVKTFGEWLDGLIKAAEGGGKAAAGGGSDKIGNVAAGGAAGANADATSVNGIAGAIKGIVEAAKKVEGVKFEPKAAADVADADGNKKAGKLFGTDQAAAEDVKDAAAAVGAVSGEQILNAIVTAAGQAGQAGQAAGDAKNAIEAAIGAGDAADFGDGIKKKNDQIAAALVLRGVAKSGKFAGADNETEKVKAVVESAVVKVDDNGGKAADGGGSDKIGNVAGAGGAGAGADATSVNGIAGAIKGIVEAAKKVEGVKFEPTAAADVDGGDGNKKAGKLFGNAAAAAGDVKDAAAAVGAVSGEQILNAIVTAAGKDGKDGKAAGQATNAIEAAIGDGDAAEFGDGNDKIGKKNDQIAAALVLRGVAKSGKFAGAANETEKVKAVVESAVVKVDDNGGKAAAGGGSDKIGNVDAAGGAGANANKESVNRIAGAIKGIVEAAKKVEGVKFEPTAAEADGDGNKKAGKLFGTAGAGATAEDVNKAAAAVGAVSGEQILNAIVTAAGQDGQDGKAAGDAKNAIEAAIGAGAAAEFGNDNDKIGKKNDQIAAALVLRGVAKDGKFAGANNAKEVKAVVESAVVKTVGEWLDGLIKAAEGGGKAAADGGGGDKIGNVDAAGAGANANKESVNGIAGAIKGIVEAAKKVEGVKFEPTDAEAADGDGNKKAGKLFGTGAGATAGDVKDAAAAVGAVSGEQILNAIVTAAGKDGKDGQAAGQAKNAIEAAIGGAGDADFGDGIKKKNDQIAAALVLRGVAKDGKFAGAADETEKVKAVVESAVVKTFGEWLDGLIKAAAGGGNAAGGGGGDKIGNVDAAGGAKADATSVKWDCWCDKGDC
ncbi:variable large family protein [Borreliella bavariensis]|uniref:variable large family protein n=3 Tax=Borreliella bavariensis TaxID=664662 RepID=UPI002E7BD003|nr:variable large family protein [Borreliella bavariensis]WLN24662.1 variable large family protein [Borreliella bavariensis]